MLYIMYIFVIYVCKLYYICCFIILKRGQFWREGGKPPLDEITYEEVLIKKVFHLTHKENIKKTKEVLRKPGKLWLPN